MIAYLKGKVKYLNHLSLVLDVAGVGYQVFATIRVLEKAKLEKEIELFTFHYLRDDAVELYGFEKKTELDFFKQLISVNGVGPRMAMAIISNLEMDQVKKTIIQGDASLIQSVSGVGAKTAERIILDLKNKVSLDDKKSFSLKDGGPSYGDIIEALMGLGYSRSEAAKLSQSVPPEVENLEERVKYALKNGGKNT